MANLQNPQFWEALLSQLLVPDTNAITQATKELNTLLENPGSVVCIFERLSNSENSGVRHQAALLVRNRLRGHWASYDDTIKNNMKDALANIIMNPTTERAIRNSTTDIISLIAKLSVPGGKWPTYFPWVISLIQNRERADLRESGIHMLENIMNSGVPELTEQYITNNYADVRQLLISGLQDPAMDVRIRTMLCMVSFIEVVELQDERATLLAILPPLVGAIKLCVDENDERVAAGFEVLDFVAENHIPQIGPILPDLLAFTLNVGGNVELEISIRQKALMFLEFVINIKPKTFASANLLDVTVQLAFKLMTEEEEDESGEDTGSKYGSQLLDSLALVMPAHMIWPLVSAQLSAFLADPRHELRKAAINALAILAEGCMEQVEDIFDDVMPMVLSGFTQEPAVRQASCIAVAEFAKHLPELIPPYGGQLVPALLTGLHDQHDLVRVKSCYAISECSSTLKEYFLPHIEALLARLVEMQKDSNLEVQELAVGALSAIVDMAEEHIGPYFGAIIDIMKKRMALTDRTQITVRGRATECVAALASAQQELFQPHFQECLQIVLNGLQIDNAELREYVYGYCEHMARLFTEAFTPFVDGIVPYLFATMESFDEFASLADSDSFALTDDAQAGIDLEKLGHMVDEKDAAISLAGWLAFNYPREYQKYVEQTHKYLVLMASMVFSPSTCASAALALVQLCSCVQTLVNPNYGWTSGQLTPLDKEVAQIIGISVEVLLQNLDSEEEIVVQSTLEAVSNLVQAFGPAALPEEVLSEVVHNMMLIMRRESTCQLVRESFDEDEGDLGLFSIVMETVSKFTQVYSQLFISPLEGFLMATRPYLEPSISSDYKNITIATIAELAQHLKGAFKPYAASFLPVAMDLLANRAEPTIKHNAAYCAGLLVQYGEETVTQMYEPLCRILLDTAALDPSKHASGLDNAAGAIARLINANPGLVPLDQLVPAMMKLLPLRTDMEPALAVHEAFFNLLKAQHPSVVNNQKQWVNIFVVELLTSDLPKDSLREQLIAYVKSLYKANAAEIDGLLQNVVAQGNASAETTERFHAVLNS